MLLKKGTHIIVDGEDFILDATTLVSRPFQPEVGDTVTYVDRKGLYHAHPSAVTLIHIHREEGDKRKWGVVAFHGDIPHSVYYEDLRPCVV